MAKLKKVVVGAYVAEATRAKLADIAARAGMSVAELAGILLKSAVDKPGLSDELERLENEKKERLIRYIM